MKLESGKEAVRLRSKKLANGSESLYLDIYLDGVRKYEFLKLYLLPGKENKLKNKETISLANTIKAKRLVEVQNGKFGFESKNKKKMGVIEWFSQVASYNKENRSDNYYSTSMTVLKHLKDFLKNKDVQLVNVDKAFVYRFIKYLKGADKIKKKKEEAEKVKKKGDVVNLGAESIRSYYMFFSVGLNKAVRGGYLTVNPCNLIPVEDKPKKGEHRREFLTLEEVKILANTECNAPMVKLCFLFSCFTGLRYVDIVALKWKDLNKVDEGVFQLEIIQQKTNQKVVVPLSDNAMQWLPERNGAEDDSLIFNMPERSCGYDYIHAWTKKAGIKKKVTFHVGRHTYATLLLYYGADLYTVSKLLGHSSVQTTQIYAKVMDESKRKAVNLIPEI